MHAPGHLQHLVGAEVQTREHVAAALHDVGVARVVDDHRVEAGDVERRLARRRHRQQERPRHLRVEERADHADRLAAVVERGRELLPAVSQLAGDLLDLGPAGSNACVSSTRADAR